MVVSPDGTKLAVVTGSNFASRAVHIIDMPTKTLLQGRAGGAGTPSHARGHDPDLLEEPESIGLEDGGDVAAPLPALATTINLLWHERTQRDPALRAFRDLLLR